MFSTIFGIMFALLLIYAGGQVDLSFFEEEAEEYWKKRLGHDRDTGWHGFKYYRVSNKKVSGGGDGKDKESKTIGAADLTPWVGSTLPPI